MSDEPISGGMPLPDLSGRVAVVTGGATGIGRATARLLNQCGVRVFVGDFNFVPELSSEDVRLGIDQIGCDVRRESDVAGLIGRANELGGGLDILVNNAGIGMVKQITEVTEADWDACMDTNLKGAFFACKHAIPLLIRSGRGAIVNVASNAGLLPRAHDPVYSISKHALVALTKSLALCHGRDRIRINAVCPGPVGDTRMMNSDLDAAADREAFVDKMLSASPLADAYQRMISPEEVAMSVIYLASDAAMMVTGTCVAIDGGKSLGVPPR
ncbi:MAG: SDR family oxidoreductase [Planctomycetales bacterium]|nr:SDR family oxidoreductase [Planctomycetales bacterium]